MSEEYESPPVEAPPEIREDLDKRISQYIWARDQLAKIDAKWEKERQEIVDVKARLEGVIHQFLTDNNITGSIKTKSGTAYISRKWSASLSDPKAFIDYVVNTGQFDLLERRASVTAVKQFVEDNKFLPAGCSLSSHPSLRVRR